MENAGFPITDCKSYLANLNKFELNLLLVKFSHLRYLATVRAIIMTLLGLCKLEESVMRQLSSVVINKQLS